jgi:hypothetical protein
VLALALVSKIVTKQQEEHSCSVAFLFAPFILLIVPEGECNEFLRNVGKLPPDYLSANPSS